MKHDSTDDEPIGGNPLTGHHMSKWEHRRYLLKNWLIRQRRRFIPYLVWHGEELDVHVTLREQTLHEDSNLDDAPRQLFSGPFYQIEQQLSELGIEFDRGLGGHGRDWEWDWSLRGPISVTFRGRASQPERRQ